MKSISVHRQKSARDVERLVSGDKRRSYSSQISRRPSASPNVDIAGRLDEVANIFAEQGANRFRVQAYRRAANALRRLSRSVADIFAEQGIDGLEQIPGIGVTIARSIRDILLHGRLAMLDRLRGESDPIAILATVPGIGKAYAWRLHDDLGIETLEELEAAAHDGRLEHYPGIGAKRLAGVRDSLAQRLGRIRRQLVPTSTTPAPPERPPAPQKPSISELLDVDREYRDKAAAGMLKKIAPRRFNPAAEAWLPIMHTARDGRHYTALFSNTARAHELGTTHDWVVLFCDDGDTEHRFTVITSGFDPLEGRRIVAGREAECEKYFERGKARFQQSLSKNTINKNDYD
jgi:DNA polymerase (family 10)